ncbi:MAG: hypothetical protein ACI9V1_001677 [Spirosomataceae bacterium]|jgi:hypothetical protein
MKTFNSLMIVSTLFVGLASCEEKTVEVKQPVVANLVENLPADPVTGVDPNTGRPSSLGKITYFSLRENKVVPETDSASSNWDIALKGTTILTNGGASGPGNGGAYVADGIFSEMKSIEPLVAFTADSDESLAVPTGSGNGWYNYNPQNNEVLPIAGKVLFIKTADGKFAKMEILGYYKDMPAIIDRSSQSRYYTFRYAYQPDGSRTFE